MALTIEDARKVARLALLDLNEDELIRQTGHLNDLIGQFTALQSVEVEGVEPTLHSIPIFNVFREDEVRPSLSRDEVLENAPDARGGCFVVPRIVDG